MPAFSPENEVRAVQIISDLMKEQVSAVTFLMSQALTAGSSLRLYLRLMSLSVKLSKYKQTIEEDEKMLETGVLKPFSNQRHAVIFIRGEKQVCHHYVTLAEKACPLLRMQWIDLREAARQHRGDDDVDRYVQEVVVPIVARTSGLLAQ